jgi:hypothetical protein
VKRKVISNQLSVISGQLNRLLANCNRLLNTDHRLLTTGHRILNTDCRILITDHRLLTTGFTVWLLALWFCSSAQAASPEARLPESHLALFQTYCFECHDSVIEEGEVDLETISFNISEDLETAETWQKVLNALNSGEMPPDDEPQIPNSEKTGLLDDLSNELAAVRKILSDSGGRITMRRLNRREYQNTMHDLLGVEVDVNSLPEDATGSGYDTDGSSQFISSDQIEQYLKIGRKAAIEAFQRRANAGFSRAMVFRIEPEDTVNPVLRNEIKELDEQHARFLAWKAGVDRAAAAPENKEVLAELLKKDPKNVPPNVQFYRNAELLKGAPSPKDYGFRDVGRAAFSNNSTNRVYSYYKHYIELPHNDRGTYLKTTWGTGRILIKPPVGTWLPGNYKLRINAGIADGAPQFRHFIQLGHPQRENHLKLGITGVISTHHITGTIAAPEMLETEIVVGADTPSEFAIQERQPAKRTDLRKYYVADKAKNGYGHTPSIWIDWIELEGPIKQSETLLDRVLKQHPVIDSTSSHTVLTELDGVREFLTAFARVAMRQTEPAEAFIDQLVAIYEKERTGGELLRVNWNLLEDAIATPLSIILASPGFLYLNEPGDEEAPRSLNDRELAVRLAYFLWSAPPDATLFELAERNQLSSPKILRQQIDRMIADSRSDEFVSGFVHQWLDMERLDFFQFDVKLHREFDESTRASARQEVYQSFSHLLRDPVNGRLGNLLKADYVLIDGLLATYYGIDGVTGDKFHKVVLPADSPRGGLLGMVAIHAMGSDGVNSSPVERGAWVLRHLLNNPPPPAPPNVPQISRLNQVLTTRERLSAHMEEAQCASCHRKIDPIGFGLENFNAAGKWRTQESDGVGKRQKVWDIDASGAFHKGPAFGDYYELRDLIAQREDDFARGFVEHLIGYALGRPFGFTDEDLANEIISSAKQEAYSVSEFIHALVRSDAFQKK